MAQTPPLSELLCFAVYSASHAFTRFYKPLLKELGLTYPQYLVMIALWAEDDQTVGGLGRQLHLESNTLTPLLKRLEKLGFVARRRDDADERQVRVTLTDEGRALQKRAAAIPDCITKASGLSADDLARLTKEIAVLRQNLRRAAT